MKKVDVVLSGCGIYGDSEIHEAVLALLAVSRNGAQAVCFAPNKQQVDVINHSIGEAMTETRNMLTEAARIAYGEVRPLAQVNATGLDTLIVPGDFDTAKNLSNFANLGSECTVDREPKVLAQTIHQAEKPFGFMYITPAVLPEILDFPPHLTIGTDIDTVEVLGEMGTKHMPYPIDDIVINENNKVVTTPAYMLMQSIAKAVSDVDKLASRALVPVERVEAA